MGGEERGEKRERNIWTSQVLGPPQSLPSINASTITSSLQFLAVRLKKLERKTNIAILVKSYYRKINSLSIDFHCHWNVRYFVSEHIHFILHFLFEHYQGFQREKNTRFRVNLEIECSIWENTEILLFRTKHS